MGDDKAKRLGQYFTPDFVADFMVSLITKPRDAPVLEPCAGRGAFLRALARAGFRNVEAYEIDPALPNNSPFDVRRADFLQVRPEERYDVVIGNPPYVRWMNIPEEWRERFRRERYWSSVMNGFSDLTYAFIYHSVNMLRDGGELIFVTPAFWTETVHGRGLREFLAARGGLEVLVSLGELRAFEGASPYSTIIFKYVKGRREGPVKVVELHATRGRLAPAHLAKVRELLGRLSRGESYVREGMYEAYLHPQFGGGGPWRPVPEAEAASNPLLSLAPSPTLWARVSRLGDVADIGNGMISGLEEAFRLTDGEASALGGEEGRGVIYVYKASALDRYYPSGRPTPYAFVDDVASEEELALRYPRIYARLARYRGALLARASLSGDLAWWRWAFPRNRRLFEEREEKILVPSKERYDTRGYFRFAYVRGRYYAAQDVTAIFPRPGLREGAKYLLALLNSRPYQEYLRRRGFSRGGVYDFSERPLAEVPVVRVDWGDADERRLHSEIVALVDEILARRSWRGLAEEVDELVSRLVRSLA